MDDLDRLTYTIPVITLDDNGLDAARSLITEDLTSGWYARRRLAALSAAGLTDFERLHPRGPDGKFIEKFGFVRWLVGGMWKRGEVVDIEPNGGVLVRPDDNDIPTLFSNPSKTLYAVPRPKAQLDLPNPKAHSITKGFTKVGGQAGSNPGAFYVVDEGLHENLIAESAVGDVPAPGDKLYVKTAKSADHARQEILANRLYEMAGVPVPDVAIGEDGITIASKIVKPLNDSQELTEVVNSGDAEMLQRIQKDMVVDAWLANWDVVGLAFDNMRVVDGTPYRLDAGGALEYRAQGGAKGNKFGNTVGELDTLRDKNMNATAAKVFGGMKTETLQRGAVRIAAISPEDIRAAVQEAGVNDSVADKLIARRKDIMMTLGVPEPADLKSPLPEATTISTALSVGVVPSAKLDINELVFDSANGVWVPGTAVDVTQMKLAFNSNLETWPGKKEMLVEDLSIGDLIFREGQLWRADATGNKDQLRLVNLGTDEEYILNSSKMYVSTYPRDPEREKMYKLLYDGVATAFINDYIENHGSSDVFFDTENMLEGPTRIDAITTPWTQTRQELLENVKHDGTKRDRYAYLNADGQHMILRIEDIITDPVSTFPDDLVFVGTDMDGNAHSVHLGDPDMAWEPIQITSNDFTEQLLDAYFSLADMQKAILDEDMPDEVPSVVPEPIDPEPVTEPSELYAIAKDSPNYAPPSGHLDPPTTPQYPPVDFVSVALPIAGEKISFAEELSGSTEQTLEADIAKLNLVGRSFLFTRGAQTFDQYGDEMKTLSPGYNTREGLFQVTLVDVQPANSYSGPRVQIHGINAAGRSVQWVRDLKELQKTGPGDTDVVLVPVDMEMKPIQPATLKQDGTIVLGGMKVGTWKKNYSYHYSSWSMTIDAAHSVYGVDTKLKFGTQKDAKRGLAEHVVPREILEPIVIPKHDSALTQEKKSIAAGKSAGMLIGGDQAVVGQWVMSTKDGLVGKITGFPNLEKYPNDVWVTTPDGAKKSRKITMLKGVPNPSAKELVVPFNDTKLADGTPVAIGMRVRVGTTAKEIEGVVLKSNAEGYIQVLDDTSGKKMWRKASTGVLLEAPDPDAVIEMKTGMKVSSPGKALGAVKYPAPDGSILPSQSIRDDWVALGRGLTKDGYVPTIGMRVRDSKGSQSLVVVRVKSVYDPSPNSVKVWDGEQHKYLWRTVTGLHVDHAAELGNGDSTIPRVKELFHGDHDEAPKLPDGTVIYKVVMSQYVPKRGPGGSGSHADIASHYVVKPTTGGGDTILLIRDGGYVALSPQQAPSVFERAKSVERVAMIDSSSSLRAQTSTSKATHQQKLSVFDPAVTTHAVIVNEDQVKELETKLALAGGVPAKTVDATSITPLPRPYVPDENNIYPAVPQITMAGSGKTLADPPVALPQAQSILGAVHAVVASRGSSDPGSSLHYGIGDADLIEDMMVRTQIVVDDDGKESVELRLHLLEPAIDKLADQLLVRDGAKKGAWTQAQVSPNALLPGDTITVRKSTTSGALKPGDGQHVPNATVAGAPKIIGQSTNGLDLYRFPVTFADGSLGEVDAEQRLSPSIALHTFDPERVQPGTGTVTLSPRATEEGWTQVHDQMGYAYGTTSFVPIGEGKPWGIYLDENGRKHITDGLFYNVMAGSRLRHTLDDGSFVDVNVAATQPGGRTAGVGSNPQRATVNGDVTIRVSLPEASDAALETLVGDAVSHLLEAVGVPPEKQEAPSKEQLTRFAINKIYKQYAKSYAHGKTPNLSDSPSAEEAQATLDAITDAVGDKLGRPAKLSDIRFKVWDGGRVSVVVSDDVASAAAKKQGRRYFVHNVYSDGGMEAILSGTGSGLMASDERWAAGILTKGMSPGSDNQNDAANRVFLKPGANSGYVNAGGHGQIYFAPRVINASADIYLNKNDGFGTRHTDNRSWLTVTGSAYELMYKRRLETSQIGYAAVNTKAEREQLLKRLRAKGITHLGNRPIEEVIIVGGIGGNNTIPPDWDANVGAGGVEIPLPSIIASPAEPAPAEGAVSAAT